MRVLCSFLVKNNSDAKRAPIGIKVLLLTVPKYSISRGIKDERRDPEEELVAKRSSGMRKIEYFK